MSGKNTFPEVLWAGTEHSLELAIEANAKIMAGPFQSSQDEEEDVPFNCTMQGDVCVVSIKGSLTNRDSWMNKYIGVTSYSDIRRAMLFAAESSSVKAILLDIDSGGGAVNGVADAGNLIRMVDKHIKPVYAFTDGTMCSAAYWIGCSAREVYSSNVSTVGSIGVIATHMEYSKQLKDDGVGVTVVRAGQFKALLNSVEAATAPAIAQLQGQLNAAYDVFVGYVADCRGVTVDQCDKQMAQGKEFFGKEALGVSLVDGIENFDSVMSKIELSLLDNGNNSNNNSGNFQRGIDMKKQALTAQQIAALAAGVQIEGAAPVVVTGEVETVATAAVVDAEAAAAEETLVVTEQEKGNVEQSASVVSFLQAQVKEKDGELLAKAVELKGLNDKISSIEATHKGLLEIARAAGGNMKVALNHSGTDLSAMSAESLLAEHAAVSDAFAKAFKAGGVAAVDAASNQSTETVIDPLHQARLAATRF